MKTGFRLILACLLASCSPLLAAESITGFLGIKFGTDRKTTTTTMVENGFKLKDDKAKDALEFEKGSYAGQPAKSVLIEFANEGFNRATVVFEVKSGKREECVRLGLEAYDSVRDQLTAQYGIPASVKSVSKSKLREGKTDGTTMFNAAWRTKGTLNAGERSITFSTTTIGLYAWVFNVVYEEGSTTATPKGGL